MRANYTKAENEALDILDTFGIDSPPIPLFEIVAAYGLNITYAKFTKVPHGNEIAGFIDLERNKIVVNADDPPTRQRFTIAHELGHYILHKKFVENKKKYTVLLRKPLKDLDYSPEEKEANCFAATLLVPKKLLQNYKDLPASISASLFAVSGDVMKYRNRG